MIKRDKIIKTKFNNLHLHRDSKGSRESDNGENRKITVLNWNIFRGYHTQFLDETSPHWMYNWKHRKGDIKRFIKEIDSDIIVFQECNRLQHSDSVERLVEDLNEYECQIFYSGEILQSRAQLIGFKKDRFRLISSGKKWLSSTPDIESDDWAKKDRWGRIVCYTELEPIENDKEKKRVAKNKNTDENTDKNIWIFNVHFDVDCKCIDNSVVLLPQILSSVLGKNYVNSQRCIVSGDFNIDSSNMIEYFAENGMTLDSSNLTTADDQRIDYTFIGKKNNWVIQSNKLQLLDYFFSVNMRCETTYVPIDYDDVQDGYTMSDHLPLLSVYDL